MNYKREIQRYLLELKELCLETPLESKLLSLDATEQIRSRVQALKGKPSRRFQIDFCGKKTASFRNYVEKLNNANPHPVYVWTEKSNSCGLFEISSLLKFNFDFRFDVNEQGIIVLVASDLTDKLVLDFSKIENSSTYQLELELHGDHWPLVDYAP